jgi:hypothetical protein
MRWRSVLLLACIVGTNSCLASDKVANTSFDAYYDGHRYEYVITHEMIEKATHWSPDVSPNPPISATEALAKGDTCIHQVSTRPTESWQLRELALGQASGGWIWVVRYRLISKGQAMTGYWPTMFCPVLMDGTVVNPVITKHEM